jgi:hypothetical protein
MRVCLFIIGLLFCVNSNAQKIDCSSQTTRYQEYISEKKFSEAYSHWEFVKKNCPKQSESIYIDGIKIVQYRIETAKSVEDKERSIRELMSLYDQFNKNFPQTTQDFEVHKAMVLVDNNIEANDEIYQLFESGFSKALDKVSSGNAIYTYFKLLTEKFEKGDKLITNDRIIEKYTLLSSQISKLFDENPAEYETYVAAKRAIDALAEKFLSCDNLADFYQKRFNQNQENEVWLTSALHTMFVNCSGAPIFQSMAEKLYSLKVSGVSANFLASASLKNRKFDDAKKYFIQSAELENNPTEKASKYYMLATGLYSSEKAKSKELLLKSLEFNPKLGKAYLFLSHQYVGSLPDCAKTEFEKKAIVYLAIQTIKKAAIADARLKSNVDLFINQNAPRSLSDKDIRNAKMNGKKMSFGCWINETIQFPSK